MSDCIFCKIVKGEIPCYKVYEDKDFLGFLDVNPFNPGHCLMIPKEHYRWVWQVEKIKEYWKASNNIALRLMKVLNPLTVLFITSGFEIDHAHIHIIPRFKNDGHKDFINVNNKKKFSEQEMKKIARKIGGVFKTHGNYC